MFKKRIEEPERNNKYWIHTSKGGYNSCILIEGNSVLANCVGYAWGRAYEILNKKPKLSRRNAENWYNYNDGYKRGQTPKLGAIICWSKGNLNTGKDGAGHVGVVEEIYSDGGILISNSNYKGTKFYTKKLNSDYYIWRKYNFQGFIYILEDNDIDDVETKKIHIVKKGETLTKIGKLYNVNYKKIAEYNNVTNPNKIYIGDKLLIPVESKIETYIIKKGDTLTKIANKYKTTWQKLYNLNRNILGNNPNKIKPGQIIIIK